MNEEYEQIREALIALLCVGDEMRFIHTGTLTTFMITSQNVAEIHESCNSFRLVNGVVLHNFNEVEYYQGALYIWGADKTKLPYRSAKRFEKIVDIIKSYDKRL
jgi:hypothetical protein